MIFFYFFMFTHLLHFVVFIPASPTLDIMVGTTTKMSADLY